MPISLPPVLLSLLLATAPAAAEPRNPLPHDPALFVAGNGLTRFDSRSHRVDWQSLAGRQVRAPALGDGLLLVTFGHRLVAIDPGNGEQRWSRTPGGELFAPRVVGAQVYVAARDGRLHALRSRDGQPLWQRQLGPGWIYPPAVHGDLLVTGGRDAEVWAVSRADGRERWRVTLAQELVYSPVVDADGRVLVTTFDGELVALDASDGAELWRSRFAAASLAPVRYRDTLLLPGLDGVLRSVDTANGRLRWRRALGAAAVAPPLIAADRVLLLTRNDDYLLLDAHEGRLLARGTLPGKPIGAVLAAPDQALVALEQRKEARLLAVSLNVEHERTRQPSH